MWNKLNYRVKIFLIVRVWRGFFEGFYEWLREGFLYLVYFLFTLENRKVFYNYFFLKIIMILLRKKKGIMWIIFLYCVIWEDKKEFNLVFYYVVIENNLDFENLSIFNFFKI